MHRHVGERSCWSSRKPAADAQDRTGTLPSGMVARLIHARLIVRFERDGERAKKGEDDGGGEGAPWRCVVEIGAPRRASNSGSPPPTSSDLAEP